MAPSRLLLLLITGCLLAAVIQLWALQIAFSKLGLPVDSFIWLLLVSAFGGVVNMPVFTMTAEVEAREQFLRQTPEELLRHLKMLPGKIIVAVNLGGCVAPVLLSFYLALHTPLALTHVLVTVALVSLVAYYCSVLVPGVGVMMPVLAAPISAALVGASLDAAHAAPLAYVGGTLGVLLGADLLRLRELAKSAEPTVSIGGAGSFDGIFLSGILAVLIC